jgi:hypothetical protein
MAQIKDISNQLGFRQHNDVYYGQYQDYWIRIKNDLGKLLLIFEVENPKNVKKAKSKLLKINNVDKFEVNKNELVLQISNIESIIPEDFVATLDLIIDLFVGYDIQSVCQLCKLRKPDEYYESAGEIIAICEECVSEIPESNGGIQTLQSNIPLISILGAIIGAFVGSSLWIIFALLGYIAAYGAIAISLVSYALYKKLGGRPSIIGLIVIIISSLVAVVFAEMLVVGIEEIKYLHGGQIQIEVSLKFISEIVTTGYETIMSGKYDAVYRNLGIGVLLAGVGTYPVIKWITHSLKLKKIEIRKIEV